jgi:hypothetical protein
MDYRKLRQGELIAAVSALLLFIFMFFSWYSAPSVTKSIEQARQFGIPTFGNVDSTIDAWEAFDFADLVMFVTIAAAIGMALLRMSDNRLNLPLSISSLVAGLGALSTLLIVYRILDTPVGGYTHRETGIYLGLIAAVALTVGGYITMRYEGITLADVRDRLLGTSQTGPPEPPF